VIRHAIAGLLLIAAAPAAAQLSPIPSFDDPRIQTVTWQAGAPIRLVTFPDSSLTLVFHSGESIVRAVLSDGNAFKATVVGYGDAIELAAQRDGAAATMRVETNLRTYEFSLETGEGLAAAFLVRLVPGSDAPPPASAAAPAPDATLTGYRLAGDRVVRPDSIVDDGIRTYIEWHRDRALPAVFGVGPDDSEEIVAGFMRDDVFVIDRIYPELVFRFNKEKATATRQPERN
jgi:type IV secretion system protein VirB9